MPIDVERVVGARLPAATTSWGPDEVILYHLGINAHELRYAYERDLEVLPTFGVVPVFPALMRVLDLPGVDVDPALILHAEHELEVHAPIPVSGTATHDARVTAVHDRVKGATIVLEARSELAGGDRLFTNRFWVYVRGEGGFGGDRGPRPGNLPPDRPPDAVASSPTADHQALLYRLSGDRNPLHADPEVAAAAGFDRPILHGLCTFGIAAKAAIDGIVDGASVRVRSVRARFAGVVYPGETVVTSLWHEGDRIVLRSVAEERDAPVLTNAAVTLES